MVIEKLTREAAGKWTRIKKMKEKKGEGERTIVEIESEKDKGKTGREQNYGKNRG